MTFQSKDDFKLVPGPSVKEIAKNLNEPVHKHFGWLTILAFAIPAFVLIVGSAFAQEQEVNKLIQPIKPGYEIMSADSANDTESLENEKEMLKQKIEMKREQAKKEKEMLKKEREKLEKFKKERQKKLKEGLGEAMKKVQEMSKQINNEIKPENVAQIQAKWEQLSKQMNELLAKYKNIPAAATSTPTQ